MDTKSYGSWSSRVWLSSSSPDAEVDDAVAGGPPDWVARLYDTGVVARVQAEYRAAINAALPPDIALCGDEFMGPAQPEPGEFDGYPMTDGALDFAAMVGEIDIEEIVDQHAPLP